MPWECRSYAAVYLSLDRGVRFGWESIFGLTDRQTAKAYSANNLIRYGKFPCELVHS